MSGAHGASANAETGSRADASSPTVSTKGFDPARFRPNSYEDKPRHMPKLERRELNALVAAVRQHMEGLTARRKGVLLRAFLKVSPVNCSWQHYGMAELFVYELAASVDRSRDGQDPQGLDAKHESAVPNGETPR